MAYQRIISFVLAFVTSSATSSNSHVTPFNKECTICLERFNVLDEECGNKTSECLDTVTLCCGHMYHNTCIKKTIISQIDKNGTIECPTCRFVFMTVEHPLYISTRQTLIQQEHLFLRGWLSRRNLFPNMIILLVLLFCFLCLGWIIYISYI
jgi:hypothetical protein